MSYSSDEDTKSKSFRSSKVKSCSIWSGNGNEIQLDEWKLNINAEADGKGVANFFKGTNDGTKLVVDCVAPPEAFVEITSESANSRIQRRIDYDNRVAKYIHAKEVATEKYVQSQIKGANIAWSILVKGTEGNAKRKISQFQDKPVLERAKYGYNAIVNGYFKSGKEDLTSIETEFVQPMDPQENPAVLAVWMNEIYQKRIKAGGAELNESQLIHHLFSLMRNAKDTHSEYAVEIRILSSEMKMHGVGENFEPENEHDGQRFTPRELPEELLDTEDPNIKLLVDYVKQMVEERAEWEETQSQITSKSRVVESVPLSFEIVVDRLEKVYHELVRSGAIKKSKKSNSADRDHKTAAYTCFNALSTKEKDVVIKNWLSSKGIKCYSCGEAGHIARNCPSVTGCEPETEEGGGADKESESKKDGEKKEKRLSSKGKKRRSEY